MMAATSSLRDFGKSLLRKAPTHWQQRIRHVLELVRSLPGTKSGAQKRWVRDVYHEHGMQARRNIFLDIAQFANINRPIEGFYFEFGSHGANTMRMAWDQFHHLFNWKFVSFDSFEGLPEIQPEDRQEIWSKGKLLTTEDAFRKTCQRHGMPAERLITVKGFYDASLNDDTRQRFAPHKAAVVYVDCDLYHSTVPILAFIKDFLQPGTIIVFDDWNCFLGDPDRGERRAWREFRAAHPELHFEEFATTGMQKAFIHTGMTNRV